MDPIDSKRQLDRIADEFENHWTPEHLHELSDWLHKVAEGQRDQLLMHLLEIDIELREKRSLPILKDDYLRWNPKAEELLSCFQNSALNVPATRSTVNRGSPPETETIPPSPQTGSKKTSPEADTIVKAGLGPAELPRRLDNYELIRRLGAGGMGEVYLARHSKFRKRLYAIKLLKLNLVGEEAIKRFENEIEVSGNLEHPNIVFATDAGNHKGEPYLVMEYVDGHDLQQILDEKGPFSIADACEAIRLAAAGLQHAFEQGFIHRDIKPANIMLSSEGEVKVLDMGLARLHEQSRSIGLTTDGQFLGTPDYMAPEQWNESSTVGTFADVYSLGCSLFTLLAGQPPYYSEQKSSIVAKMSAHVSDDIPDLSKIKPGVPDELATIVRKAMAKDPGQRFESLKKFASALKSFAAGANLQQHATPSNFSVEIESEIPTESRKRSADETYSRRPLDTIDSNRERISTKNSALKLKGLLAVSIVASLLAAGLWLAGSWLAGSWLAGFFGGANQNDKASVDRTTAASANREATALGKEVGPVEFFAYRLNAGLTTQYDEINGKTPDGRVVYEGEKSRLEIGFTKPVHFMVFAFTPAAGEGRVQLIWPEDAAANPAAGEGFLFLRQPSEMLQISNRDSDGLVVRNDPWVFSDGAGLHSFLVISSREPLPSFDAVRTQLFQIDWNYDNVRPKQWKIRDGLAMQNIVSQGSLELRGVDSDSKFDLQIFVDSVRNVFAESTAGEARIDGIVFDVEPGFD